MDSKMAIQEPELPNKMQYNSSNISTTAKKAFLVAMNKENYVSSFF